MPEKAVPTAAFVTDALHVVSVVLLRRMETVEVSELPSVPLLLKNR